MKRLLSLSACLALAVGAVACGGGDDSDGTSSGTSGNEDVTEATNALDVTLTEYAFGAVGEAQAGPLQLNFTNSGEQIHHAIVGKIDEGKTLEDIEKEVLKDGPPPPWFDDTPLDLAVLSPGQSSGVWIDAEPGNYVLLCFMPDPKGKPHVASGMYSIFEVSEATGEVAAIEPDVSISMSEKGAEVPELEAGESVLSVTNDGKAPGEFVVAQFGQGKTVKDVDKWFGSGMKGPAPVQFFGGTHAFEPGQSVTTSVDLEPGDYTFVITYEVGNERVDELVDFTVV